MRKLLACGAAVAAVLAVSTSATARQVENESVVRDAGLAELDKSIAWIDYILGRVDAGDLLLFDLRASMAVGADHQTLVPINREDTIQAIQLDISDGVTTSEEGAETLIAMARDTARYRTSLRGQRDRLAARREQTRAALARLPQRPLQPWELGRPPQQRPMAPAARDEEPTGLVAERFSEVCAAIGVQNCARMYADVSVILARHGARIGWIDGMDQRAPAGDPGRGVTSWDAHYRHGAGPGAGRLGGPIAQRLEDLHYGLDPATEARMEREANGAINGYAPKY